MLISLPNERWNVKQQECKTRFLEIKDIISVCTYKIFSDDLFAERLGISSCEELNTDVWAFPAAGQSNSWCQRKQGKLSRWRPGHLMCNWKSFLCLPGPRASCSDQDLLATCSRLPLPFTSKVSMAGSHGSWPPQHSDMQFKSLEETALY